MSLNKKSGFTLIELMVVIVIIGVLASLAIPRFTEASAKAKIAEAPRVIASYESAFLSRIAETGTGPTGLGDLIFTTPNDSKWFSYTVTPSATLAANQITAVAKSDMAKFKKDDDLLSVYAGSTDDCFVRSSPKNDTEARKMVPNFFNDCVKGGGGDGDGGDGDGDTP